MLALPKKSRSDSFVRAFTDVRSSNQVRSAKHSQPLLGQHMSLGRKVLLCGIVIGVLGLCTSIWLIRRTGCSDTYWLNPDVTCRVLDAKENGTYLIQYFNADTNELRLYVQRNRKDVQIEHPHGKVKDFKDVLSQNELRFNSRDDRSLLVNGEVFPITPK